MSMTSSSPSAEEKRRLLAQLLRERAARAAEVPLSAGQLRLWRMLHLDHSLPVYNIPIAYQLDGPLDLAALESAIKSSASRHESLRAKIVVSNAQPVHIIANEIDLQLDRIDATAVDSKVWPAERKTLVEAAAQVAIEVEKAPLWRFTLIKRSEREHIFVVVAHHVISDRWSVGLLIQEIAKSYVAATTGAEPPVFPEAVRYRDAIVRVEASLQDDVLTDSLNYWRTAFQDDVPELKLANDLVPVTGTTYRGDRFSFDVSEALTRQLDAMAEGRGVTPYVVFLAILAARLHHDTGQTDLVLITPFAGRQNAATRGVLGYFNNLVPLRLVLPARPSFDEILQVAQQVYKATFLHQDVPFARIAEMPGLERTNLARCLFSLQTTASLDLELPGIVSSYHDVPTHTANFDLAVFFERMGPIYRGFVDAKTDLWSLNAIDGFVRRFVSLLSVVIARPDVAIADLGELLPPARKAHTKSASSSSSGETKKLSEQPANELERRLIGIWESVLGISPLLPSSNFFSLGGHSLVAAKLFDRMGKELGRELPLAALFQAPTIRELTKLLANGDDAPCWASLVPIQPKGTRPPIFCVHGGGGGVLTFSRFGMVLGPDQPLYGLQTPRQSGSNLTERVEDLAQLYLEAILTVQPKGPYRLCGHSFGGLVAYDISKRLYERGESVSFLGVIDFPGPNAKTTKLDKIKFHIYMLSQLNFREKIPYMTERVGWQILKSERMPMWLRKLFMVRVPGRGDWDSATHRLKSINTSMYALSAYRVKPYPGPLTLFKAKHGSQAINSDPHGGWLGVAQGGVDVKVMACKHMLIMEPPYIDQLATFLKESLDAVLDTGPAPIGTAENSPVS
jgi:thioesterase domain-containing protein/acyl carrier protein